VEAHRASSSKRRRKQWHARRVVLPTCDNPASTRDSLACPAGYALLLTVLLHALPARERTQTGRVAPIDAFHGRIPSRVKTPQMRGVIACLFASAGPAAGR
jgi:hypothetical protein